MADCGCGPTAVDTADQRRVLKIALALNATMFVVEVAAGSIGHPDHAGEWQYGWSDLHSLAGQRPQWVESRH